MSHDEGCGAPSRAEPSWGSDHRAEVWCPRDLKPPRHGQRISTTVHEEIPNADQDASHRPYRRPRGHPAQCETRAYHEGDPTRP